MHLNSLSRAERWQAAAPLFLLASISAFDFAWDVHSQVSLVHLAIEAVLTAGGFWASWRLANGFRSVKRSLAHAIDEAARWKESTSVLARGLSEAMDTQFEAWKLTRAEREVARLLLKGLSSKEIATVRATEEKTVRHQTGSIYQKSGLGGRAELAAFFLEDLLAPQVPETRAVVAITRPDRPVPLR